MTDDRLERAERLLAAWRIAEAEAVYAELEPEPGVCERLALCADARGDHEAAEGWMRRAGIALPGLDEAGFDAVVERAIDALPEQLQRVIEEQVPVIVEPMPTLALLGGEPGEIHPDTLGLYMGPPLDEPQELVGLPPTIHVFRRNLARICESTDRLVEEIRITLYHELGHALGLDEDGVADRGLA